MVAQCLAAAQHTIPAPSPANNHAVFLIHSMHCYFVLAGDASIPILYHVERVREGKSFMTRTVQARQRGKCIFTTTASFMREGSGGEKTVGHSWDMPDGAQDRLTAMIREDGDEEFGDKDGGSLGVEEAGPFITKRMAIVNRTLSPLSPFHSWRSSPLTAHRYRIITAPAPQENPPMAESPWPHLRCRRPTCPPLRSGLYV